MIVVGAAQLGLGAFVLAQLLATGTLGERFVGLVTIVAIGLGLLVPAVVQLPGWARLRQRQMEEIAERALLMASSESTRSPDSE
jgi:hypothetical protein